MFQIFTTKSQSRASMSNSDPYHSFTMGLNSFSTEMGKLQSITAKDMQQESRKCDLFFKAIENWKNLQTHYINKLSEIQQTFKEKVFNDTKGIPQPQNKIDAELINLFNILINNHKAMIKKVEYDIIMVSLETSHNLCKDIKEIITEDKADLKGLTHAKEQLQKVLTKKNKLKRQKQEELMLQIFMQDSIDCTMEQKIRRFTKFKEIEKQKQQYQLKVSESVESYKNLCESSRKNHLLYYTKMQQFNQCKYETVLKMQLHLLTFFKNLTSGIQDMVKQIHVTQAIDNNVVVDNHVNDKNVNEKECENKDIINNVNNNTFNNNNDKKQRSFSPSLNSKQPIMFSATKSQLMFQGNQLKIDNVLELNKKQQENKARVEQRKLKEYQLLQKIVERKVGYVEFTLKLIIQKEIDDLLTYSKDKDVKGRIKRMMQTNEIDPQQTDEMSRQIQIIKRIMKNPEEKESIDTFCSMINKSAKLRMNFIFFLQFNRLNGKFELQPSQFKAMYILVNKFLECVRYKQFTTYLQCHQKRDCFVLKQLMILLMTYYVTFQDSQIVLQSQTPGKIHTENNISSNDQQQTPQLEIKKKASEIIKISKQKIYILHFFKNHELWRDLEFWESLLIECVYSQKKSTLKMLLVGLETSAQKKQMMQAQKTSIMSQVLYVVKNMIIFEFTQKQVKSFSVRFAKLLKQDQKSLKDVNNTIENAAREEKEQLCQTSSIDSYVQTFLK